ncbi:MAG: cation-translocating P-type ATPase [Desulfobulbaceae bacterium]|nr:cation-translocating P-type ATPase [Desulfobulbaceae bacterium]HIJ79324.1 cation-translocating P-type ATPase [Deltaproteobacteria bacterium]
MNYYNLAITKIFTALNTDQSGLATPEAQKRLAVHGPNALTLKSPINPLFIFISQFKNFIIYILLFAVFFALLIGEYVDSLIILAILLTNAVIGFFQELSAHRSLEALKELSAVKATVLRDGQRVVVDARYLVPGDVIEIEAGDKVPADARLIKSVRLKIEESSLTGESVPVEKNNLLIEKEVQIGEQHNMLFSSTSVVTGNGKAVVTATGMATEIGKISLMIAQTQEEMTPLQKRLHVFGKKLGGAIIGICTLIFLIFLSKELLHNGFSPDAIIAFVFIAISLAVAAVPTALPAVVTIALSIGVKRLLRKKALVRTLSAVETLGSCDIICTDKTGTLTENQMTVRYAWTPDGEASISGTGYAPEGTLSTRVAPILFISGMGCNNGSLIKKNEHWQIIGDPTEAALLTSGAKAGVEMAGERVDELPFDSDRKMMSVLVRESDSSQMMYSKGAPNQLLACCSQVLINNEIVPLDPDTRQRISAQNDLYADQALRVLGFACKSVDKGIDFTEENLVFLGLQAMIDPPRAEVIEAIRKTKRAGIRVIMITGDYQATALAIGREIGITGKVVSGEELERMSDDELIAALADNTNIFARVVPEHKLRIVTALQQLDHTVAMTGDGVNDAPALKKANIGIAVGSGTEVAKEASDFVLLDDSFSHIVNAIEEGRGIYDNIQKSIMLLLSGNLGEVLIIFLAALLGMNLPLTAILLLWINMVTDGAPALAYSVDPYGIDIMIRQPKAKNENILPNPKLILLGVLGTVGTLIALTLFSMSGGNSPDQTQLIRAQTMVFNFVVLYEVILIFVIRRSFKVPLLSNKWVWAAAVLSIALQGLLMYSPMRYIFKISALNWTELSALALAGFIFYLVAIFYQFFVKADNHNLQSASKG